VRQWEHTVARRTYVTGGMGSRHTGESFGEDFELPPDRAYAETCAGVASVMLAWRLLLATGDARYADLAERTLYNIVATSPALDGRSFFYPNPLHQRVPSAPPADAENPRPTAGLRSPWFHVSCCPTNVARTLASLAAYVATADDDGVQIHQLAPCTVRTALPDGRSLGLRVDTGYPWTGDVVVRVEEADGTPWRISVRVPAWADGAVLVHDDRRRPVAPGYAMVESVWRAGDELRLELPVGPRWTRPDRRVDAVRGCVALERGPLVYCLESVDQRAGADLGDIAVDASGEPSERPADQRLNGAVAAEAGDLTFIPYYAWGNRGPSTMRVWVPER
jgi:DUF1680 family protein